MTRQEYTAKALEWLKARRWLRAEDYCDCGLYCETVSKFVNGKLSVDDILYLATVCDNEWRAHNICDVPQLESIYDKLMRIMFNFSPIETIIRRLTKEEQKSITFSVYWWICVKIGVAAIGQRLQLLHILCKHRDTISQFADLQLQYNDLKKKWYSFLRNKEDDFGEKFRQVSGDVERAVDDKISAMFMDFGLSPAQKHGLEVWDAAYKMSESYISNLPCWADRHELETMDKEQGEGIDALKKVAEADTDERKQWFSSFMGIFKNLSLASGWRLSARSRRCYGGGCAEFFVTNDKGDFCEDPLDEISVSGDMTLGAIEAGIFNFIITQVDLSWHSLYAQGWIVRDIPSLFRERPEARPVVLEIVASEKWREFCDYDFSPKVSARRRKNEYWVRYVLCHVIASEVGFFQQVVIVHTSGCIRVERVPHRFWRKRFGREELFTYDSGWVL